MNLRTIYTVIALVTFLLLTISGKAQDGGRKISLDEAIDLSIQNSKILRSSYARIKQAEANTTISKQNQLPDLKITGAYMRVAQPNISMQSKGIANGIGAAPLAINQAAYGIANLSLPVYSGHKIQYGIRSSELLEKAAAMDAEQDKEAVINTIDAGNLYKAKANLRVVQENLIQSRSRDKDFENLEKRAAGTQ
jgi:outer membrane protein TolC